jgi:hypothetical protein
VAGTAVLSGTLKASIGEEPMGEGKAFLRRATEILSETREEPESGWEKRKSIKAER